MNRVRDLVNGILASKEAFFEYKDEVILRDLIPDTKPPLYLHEFFKPWPEEVIRTDIVETFKYHFPEEVQEFYRITNGCFLFGRQIRIYGYPHRTAEYMMVRQPSWLQMENNNLPPWRRKEKLLFASYAPESKIHVFYNTNASGIELPVIAVREGEKTILKAWKSFGDWFMSEYDRYMEMYQNQQYTMRDIGNRSIGKYIIFSFNNVL